MGSSIPAAGRTDLADDGFAFAKVIASGRDFRGPMGVTRSGITYGALPSPRFTLRAVTLTVCPKYCRKFMRAVGAKNAAIEPDSSNRARRRVPSSRRIRCSSPTTTYPRESTTALFVDSANSGNNSGIALESSATTDGSEFNREKVRIAAANFQLNTLTMRTRDKKVGCSEEIQRKVRRLVPQPSHVRQRQSRNSHSSGCGNALRWNAPHSSRDLACLHTLLHVSHASLAREVICALCNSPRNVIVTNAKIITVYMVEHPKNAEIHGHF